MKYGWVEFDNAVKGALKEGYSDIRERYEIDFWEMGTGKYYVYFLVQSVAGYSATRIVTMHTRIPAKDIFKYCSWAKRRLLGVEFWKNRYLASAVGKHGDKATIGEYVKYQELDYQNFHSNFQSKLFEILVLLRMVFYFCNRNSS